MRGYLLDTHILLWWLSDPKKLPRESRDMISDGRNPIYVSTAAVWEMAIKRTLGRLDFQSNLEELIRSEHIDVLPISLPHALAVADLPLLHHDPFDRMQIAQARIEDLTLVTRDSKFKEYDVKLLRA